MKVHPEAKDIIRNILIEHQSDDFLQIESLVSNGFRKSNDFVTYDVIMWKPYDLKLLIKYYTLLGFSVVPPESVRNEIKINLL